MICKLCEGVTLAYAGRTSNLFNDLEAKHSVTHTKVVPKECSTQKQTTLGTFTTACPPARANMLITECVTRDSDARLFARLKLKGSTDYSDIRLLGHADIWIDKSNMCCSPTS